ncbi:hypothetical protein MCORR_v1c02310 [Mesoplasma corruscae]|uniref:Uncharacterized protein n=2 Tax=Mesoplasma corruscae TaxID=216874 RepID=A0A2S5RH22_9MOLU|nr:hypothetical protein MCORR_v1c02310 [Mesoplasma corruscae]
MIMRKNIKNETLLLIATELFSAICGIIGVILGILSLLSLDDFVWGKPNERLSFIFTVLTVCFDFASTTTAIIAFKFGGLIIKRKESEGKEICLAEKFANKLDLYSFFFGLFGLLLSILSLLFLFEFMKSDVGSEIATVISVICDSVSALIVLWVFKIMIKLNGK